MGDTLYGSEGVAFIVNSEVIWVIDTAQVASDESWVAFFMYILFIHSFSFTAVLLNKSHANQYGSEGFDCWFYSYYLQVTLSLFFYGYILLLSCYTAQESNTSGNTSIPVFLPLRKRKSFARQCIDRMEKVVFTSLNVGWTQHRRHTRNSGSHISSIRLRSAAPSIAQERASDLIGYPSTPHRKCYGCNASRSIAPWVESKCLLLSSTPQGSEGQGCHHPQSVCEYIIHASYSG